MDFFIDIGITVLLRLLATRRIPAGYVKGLMKLRDALLIAFPPNQAGVNQEAGFKVV